LLDLPVPYVGPEEALREVMPRKRLRRGRRRGRLPDMMPMPSSM